MPDTATTYLPPPDYTPPADAVRFIELLTGSAESVMHFSSNLIGRSTFRTFTDKKNDPNPKSSFSYCRMDNGTNFQLKRRQDQGHGVFVCINAYEVDNYDSAIHDEDITNVRAFFVDSDGTEMPEHWHLEPTFTCWRDDAHWHAYWVLVDGYDPKGFRDAQLRLAAHYNTDTSVANASRVMRVPGYLHLKETPSEYHLLDDGGARYTADQVLAGIAERPQEDPKPQREQRSIPLAELRSTLQFVEPTFAGDHNTWIGICKAIQDMPLDGDVSAEDRWKVIVDWCSGALWNARTGDRLVPETYKGEAHLRRTIKESQGRGEQTTYGTICHYAQKNGWGAPRRVGDPDADPMDANYELECLDMGDDHGPIPPREWVLGNTFCKSFLSSTVSPGGVGKTSLKVLQALGIATGRGAITGEYVFRRSRVLILTFEDDLYELRRRVDAAMIHHKISRDELKGWLFCQALTGMKMPSGSQMKIASIDKKGNVEEGAFLVALERFITKHQIDCVILDPFIKTHSVNENANNEIDYVVAMLAGLAIRNNIAVDVPHHTNKQTMEAGNANASRGASAFVDAGRLVYTVTPMTSDEAKRFGISESDRVDYVRVDNAKVNIIRKKASAWFKMVSVNLGNSNQIYRHGDSVQAMEPWTPPEALEGLDENIQTAILADIDSGMPNGQRYSNHHNAKDRHVGQVIRKYLPNKTDKQAEEIIGKWIKEVKVSMEEYDDPIKREKRKGLVVLPPF